ncbi:MAG: histidine phosphatase family protein [Chloracidobacterium sp.]|nr:histidine phosphatase family protein [Chloracidobacterium sp.]
MPNELVIVRHGHSEGNLVLGESKKGDHSLLTPDVRETPGHRWRLTPKGREQAAVTGKWIAENFPNGFDRYYASPFVRTRETAALLGLTNAEWRLDQRLRERDWGEINSMPTTEHESSYPQNALIKRIDALYWRPPAGESIADVRLRVRNFFDPLHRECEGQRVLVVTHGEFMSAARAALEYMSDEQWVLSDNDPAHKIFNTHVYQYSRLDPHSGESTKYLSWRQSVCPHRENTDTGWTRIQRNRFSNEELLEQVSQIGSIIETPAPPPEEPDLEFVRLPEEPWTTYFEAFPEDAMSDEYRLVPVDKLILMKGAENNSRVGNSLSPVERAHRFMADLANGVPGAGKRVPISVRSNADGTYSVLDGNATTAVAKMQGWKQMPVHIIEDQNTTATSDLKDR